MKRYLAFAYDTFYPLGGWNDFVGRFDTVEGAAQAALDAHRDEVHVVDAEDGVVVWSYR